MSSRVIRMAIPYAASYMAMAAYDPHPETVREFLRRCNDSEDGMRYERPDGPGMTLTVAGIILSDTELDDLAERVDNIVRDPEAAWTYGRVRA